MNELQRVAKECSRCQRCSLRESATSPVFGSGELTAKYFILGEAPGREEDKAGIPFVGFSGNRLNQLLVLSGIDINECYLTNVCKCWPPKVNGKQTTPKKKERQICFEWLSQELLVIRPKTIITLGATPLSMFTESGITQLHGTQFDYHMIVGKEEWDLVVMPMYHPAAAGYMPRLWAVMLDDWQNKPEKVNSDAVILPYLRTKVPLEIGGTVSLDTENDEHGTLGQWSVAKRGGELTVQPMQGTSIPIRYNSTARVIMHNAKWDLRVLKRNGMAVPPPKQVVDTMIAAYCLHPSTRVLTRDLKWVEIGSIKVGQELIGIDEEPPMRKQQHGRRTMLPSKVLAMGRRLAPCCKITFSNGTEVVATDDHPWLTNMNRHQSAWKTTRELRPRWRMLSPLVTWQTDTTYDGGYLAGILDGEGCWSKWNLQIAQKPGAVLDKTKLMLTLRNVPYSETARADGCNRLTISCTTNAMPLVGSVRATRLINKEAWNSVSPSRRTDPNVFVLSVEPVGVQEVVSIETSTHTFNAEGFWTHNCLGLGRQDTKDSGRSGDKMVGGLGLKYLARRHLGMQMQTWNEAKDHPEIMEQYNANDSVATLLLWEKWEPILPQYFWDIDMPLLDVLMCMEDRGILVDSNFLQEYAKELDAQLTALDLPLNPYSHKQVSDYVYGTLGVEPTKFTESKQPSVDKEVLETIDDPIVRKILEYRDLYKEKTTYVGSYIDKMGLDNRIHGEFKQTSTATSRLSSAQPNLQNVTKSDKLRGLFVAAPGHVLIRADWSQIELRVFAALAGEDRMLEALHSGRGLHQETADALGLEYDEGKIINFLMLYGGTPWKISQEFHVPIGQAQEIERKYYKAFPGIKKYHEQQTALAHNDRKVSLWTGRTRRLDGMYSNNRAVIRESEREAVNTPVQGGAAEVVKRAMIKLHYEYHAPMILQVHDELIFEVLEKEAKEYARFVYEFIPTVTELNGVRFPAEVGVGKTWAESKKNTIFK